MKKEDDFSDDLYAITDMIVKIQENKPEEKIYNLLSITKELINIRDNSTIDKGLFAEVCLAICTNTMIELNFEKDAIKDIFTEYVDKTF